MGKVNLCSPLFSLSEVLKLRAVVGSDGFENVAEIVTKLGVKRLHSGLYSLADLARNLHGNVVVMHSFDDSKDHRFFAVSQTDNGISFPSDLSQYGQ